MRLKGSLGRNREVYNPPPSSFLWTEARFYGCNKNVTSHKFSGLLPERGKRKEEDEDGFMVGRPDSRLTSTIPGPGDVRKYQYADISQGFLSRFISVFKSNDSY